MRLFGCTEKAQAIREGKYMSAANRYHRRLVIFQTEWECLIPAYGDLIAIVHDMPSWGQGKNALDFTPCSGERQACTYIAFDIATLRDLAGSIKTMQLTFLQNVVHWVTIGVLGLLVASMGAKLGPFTPK